MLVLIFFIILKISSSSFILAIAPSSVELLNPSLFTCSCDLTDVCDLNCCCDKSCSDSDKLLFKPSCKAQIRSLINVDIDKWFCNDIFGNPRLNEYNWFPFVCVNSATTVLLGKFYSPYDLSNFSSSRNFLPKIEQSIKESYNYRSSYINDILGSETLIRESEFCSLTSVKQYNYAACLKLTHSSLNTLASRFFTFPSSLNGLSSTCNYENPVRYLINQPRSSCPISMDNKMKFCASPKLNYKNYVSSNLLIKNPRAAAKVTVSFEYWKCSPYTAASENIPNLSHNKSCQAPETLTSCIFDPNSQIFDSQISGLCASSRWRYLASRINDIPLDFNSKLFSKCTKFDTTVNEPSVAVENICLDAVVSVKNLLFWAGGSVTRAVTQIILADITFNTSAVLETQKFHQLFEIKWLNEKTPVKSINEYNSFVESTEYVNNLKTSLRGIAQSNTTVSGYIDGNIIISGVKDENAEKIVDISYNQRISSYKILNGKLCGQYSNQERIQIRFNQNLSSTCFVRLTMEDLSSRCSCLKNLIFNKLNDYFAPSNYVSKNGAPDMNQFNASEWLNVYPLQRIFNETSEKNLNETELKGFCSSVPYKIIVNFMFARVGKASGIDFNEIIGVYISYSYRDWRFSCKIEDKKKCIQSEYTQDFNIEFEVKFINTTYRDSAMSFIEKCNSDHSYSMACIQQVFFLWPQDYNDPNFFYHYTVQLSIVFGAFSLGLVYLMVYGMVCPC